MADNRLRCEIVADLTKEGWSVLKIAQELSMTMAAVRSQRTKARRVGLLPIDTRERAANGMRKCRGPCHRIFVEAHYHDGDQLCPDCRTVANLRRARQALLRGEQAPTRAPGVDPWPLWRALGLPEVAPVPAVAPARVVRSDEEAMA